MYNVADMEPAKHPIPGLAHLTLQGRKAHGLKGVELWMSTLAPGAGTPIHRHACCALGCPGQLKQTWLGSTCSRLATQIARTLGALLVVG